MKRLTIAIDGPAGAGKSSIAKALAEELHYLYVDTGAMYRAITWKALQENSIHQRDRIIEMLHDLDMEMVEKNKGFSIYVNHEEVNQFLRSPEINRYVSKIATIKEVRNFLVNVQRRLAKKGGIILDGRDIGSVVLPNADIKFYLTASVEARARRRWLEMTEKGIPATLEEVKGNVEERDYMDSHRDEAPLVQVKDAILIDSSNMSFNQTKDKMISLIKEKESL